MLRWSARPRLRRPVMLCAFEGWNDAGDAASFAVRYLGEAGTRAFADVDPEEHFDFTTTRPDGAARRRPPARDRRPGIEFSAGPIPGTDRDVILLSRAASPSCAGARSASTSWRSPPPRRGLVVTLGALLAEVPTLRPVSVIGTAVDDGLIERLGLARSSYEGPTGIVGVLRDAKRAGLPPPPRSGPGAEAVPGAPSPKAALALIERLGGLLGRGHGRHRPEIATAEYERQIDELVDEDGETTGLRGRPRGPLRRRRTDDDDLTWTPARSSKRSSASCAPTASPDRAAAPGPASRPTSPLRCARSGGADDPGWRASASASRACVSTSRSGIAAPSAVQPKPSWPQYEMTPSNRPVCSNTPTWGRPRAGGRPGSRAAPGAPARW